MSKVDEAGTGRQLGSSFKVFALAKALEKWNISAPDVPSPSRHTFPSCRGTGCTIRNASERAGPLGGPPQAVTIS